MLTPQRNQGDCLIIQPKEDIPPEMTVKELFSDGPIVVMTTDSRMRIGVEAPNELLVVREEKF